MGNCCGLCPEKEEKHKLKDTNTTQTSNQTNQSQAQNPTQSQTQNETQNLTQNPNQTQKQNSTQNPIQNPIESQSQNTTQNLNSNQTIGDNSPSKPTVRPATPPVTYREDPSKYKTASRNVLAAAAERRLAQQKTKIETKNLKPTTTQKPSPPNTGQGGLKWTVG